jgi:hypothetical protein
MVPGRQPAALLVASRSLSIRLRARDGERENLQSRCLCCLPWARPPLHFSLRDREGSDVPGPGAGAGNGRGYAISNAIFGGSAEVVALQLKDWKLETSFFWYVTARRAIVFLVSLRLPKTASYLHTDH